VSTDAVLTFALNGAWPNPSASRGLTVVYVVRLTQGTNVRTTRVVVFK
jgi:hypothetical protein